MDEILRFEHLMDEIEIRSRRTMIILRCRYALGMQIKDIAHMLRLNRDLIHKEINSVGLR